MRTLITSGLFFFFFVVVVVVVGCCCFVVVVVFWGGMPSSKLSLFPPPELLKITSGEESVICYHQGRRLRVERWFTKGVGGGQEHCILTFKL